jgi:hypothetical protein
MELCFTKKGKKKKQGGNYIINLGFQKTKLVTLQPRRVYIN